MSFPSSPVNGQTAVINSITYTYSSATSSWSRQSFGAFSKISTGTAPPASPNLGDLWYDTNSGAVYRWTYDGTTNYWIDTTGGSDLFFSSANVLTISSNVASTSSDTGALVVRGGAGISGNLFVGNINVYNKNMITSLIFGS
jgi:hypothetical protein